MNISAWGNLWEFGNGLCSVLCDFKRSLRGMIKSRPHNSLFDLAWGLGTVNKHLSLILLHTFQGLNFNDYFSLCSLKSLLIGKFPVRLKNHLKDSMNFPFRLLELFNFLLFLDENSVKGFGICSTLKWSYFKVRNLTSLQIHSKSTFKEILQNSTLWWVLIVYSSHFDNRS